MKQWLTPAERSSLAVLLGLIAAGYLVVGWRHVRETGPPVALDSLDFAFIRQGVLVAREALAAESTHVAEKGHKRAVAKETRPRGPLDLNAADSTALLGLPGIGPTKVAAILAWRRSHGRFQSAEDLLKIKGIGPATLKKLRPALLPLPGDRPTGAPDSLSRTPVANARK